MSGIEEISKFCENNEWYNACYDFSHIFGSQEKLVDDIQRYRDYIKIFHLSNRISEPRKQHLSISKRGDLNFNKLINIIKENYSNVALVLEYLYEYHYKLSEDALRLKDILNKK